jgi:predicted anti-sigma-YlaC factor YlaD
MHEPVQAHLEDFLSRKGTVPDSVADHLASCSKCRSEVNAMEAQIPMLRSLRSPDGAEPRAGLYARVIERIESQRPLSIWTAFLEPAFGPRLAIASAVLAIIMGIFLVSGEPTAPAPMPIAPDSVASAVAEREDAAPAFTGAAADDQQVRNAVFVSLATYRD